MVRITDIQDNSIMWNDVPYCQIDDTKIPQYMLHKGDILFARTGSTVGKSILIKDAPFDAVFAGYLVRTQCVSNILPQFAKCFLESSVYWNQLKSGMTATAQPNFNGEKLSSMIFPLPPLAEQKRIVAKVEELFAYADQIGSASEEITKTAQRLDKKILDLAIRGKLVPQDPNDEPASELVKRIEAARNEKTGSKKSRAAASHKPTYEIEPPFDIPESWEWVRLGEVFNHNTGKALNRNNAEGVLRKYITTSNVHWDEFKLDELKQMPFTDEELNKCTVRKGDLLVCEGGDIGRAAIWNFNKEVCIQNHLHRLRAYSEVCVPYFCFVLRLYKATNRLQGKGIGLQGFSSGMLHNLIIPLPPLAEQKRIVAKIEELRAMTRALTT